MSDSGSSPTDFKRKRFHKIRYAKKHLEIRKITLTAYYIQEINYIFKD